MNPKPFLRRRRSACRTRQTFFRPPKSARVSATTASPRHRQQWPGRASPRQLESQQNPAFHTSTSELLLSPSFHQLPVRRPAHLPPTKPSFPASRSTRKGAPASLVNPLNSSSRAFIHRSTIYRPNNKRPAFSNPKSHTSAHESAALQKPSRPAPSLTSSPSSLIVEPSLASVPRAIPIAARPRNPARHPPLRHPPGNPKRIPPPTMNPTTQPSSPTSASQTPDLEANLPAPPLTPHPSHRSLRPHLPWGPSHPCYPHPNPHVPLSSPLHVSTRIIRIPRTYLLHGDLAPSFSTTYPEILDPAVTESEFRELVGHVNEGLARACDPWAWQNWVDAVVGAATGWVWEDLGGGWERRGVREVEAWLEAWNREREGRGGGEELVRVWGGRRTGFLSLDFQVVDPQVGLVGEGDEGEREGEGEGTGDGDGTGTGDGDGTGVGGVEEGKWNGAGAGAVEEGDGGR